MKEARYKAKLKQSKAYYLWMETEILELLKTIPYKGENKSDYIRTAVKERLIKDGYLNPNS